MRGGHRSLSSPLVRLSCGPTRYIPALKGQRSRLSRDCVTGAGGMSRRSIRSSLRRAARERWSSSTLGTLLLHWLILIMAPSTARMPPKRKPESASPITRRSPRMCEPLHIAGVLFCGGVRAARSRPPGHHHVPRPAHRRGRVGRRDLAGGRPIEQVTDRAEPLPHARHGKLACRPSACLGRPGRRTRRQDFFQL